VINEPTRSRVRRSANVIPAAEEFLSQVEQETQTIVAEVVAELGESAARIPVHVQTLLGRPAGVLIEPAHGADLLVVGHRGRGGVASALLGPS
jgi:nucleotide-binding universal stress UspA family protein